MKKIIFLLSLLCSFTNSVSSQEKEVTLKLVETSDVHGNYFPYNFMTHKHWGGSLARVSSYVNQERAKYGKNLILIDNGDILQGQPTVYYYNYIDTVSPHLTSEIMNYMKYDAGNMGNHDVEASKIVFDRWIKQCNFPILGANIIDVAQQKPYLPPYVIFEREGVKVAVLGMITPAIPAWLPESLWKGLSFHDMEETAKKWMPVLRSKADVVIGVFHAGKEPYQLQGINENASVDVAKNVPGFDAILIGHDHDKGCFKVKDKEGNSVLVIDPKNNAQYVSSVEIQVKKDNGKVISKSVNGELIVVDDYPVDKAYMNRFSKQFDEVKQFVSKKIGTFSNSINAKSAFFGPSRFVDLIHKLQLDISGADVSFVAPLSMNARINRGDVFVSDMFNLYKFENLLYTMELTGKEIKGALEESYYIWTNQMKSADDHLLWLEQKEGRSGSYYRFANFSFNFDSAAGIKYTVDVTKPKGEKIHIISMADGTPFSLTKTYKVAVNSYRGNGGGELLTKGAGISHDELSKRVIHSTSKDLRYYLMKQIEELGTVTPKKLNSWKFIPEEWTAPAAQRDSILLFKRK